MPFGLPHTPDVSSLKTPRPPAGPQAGDSWCEVGPQGKHKHVPRHYHRPDRQHLLHPHFTDQPPGAADVSDRKQLLEVLSLTLLPGTALACIFHNLDSSSAFSLAQTCRACASEFVQQKSELAKKCLAELTPTVICTPRGDHDGVGQDGVYVPSLSFAVHWKDSSKDAICSFNYLSQKPGFWRSFWSACWSTFQWSETLVDDLLISTYEEDGGYVHYSDNSVHVDMLMESNEKLYVTWDWLHAQLLDSFAAVLLEALWAARSWPSGDHRIMLRIRLYRPAKDGRFQEVMHHTTDCRGPDSDYVETFSMHPYDMQHSYDIWSEYSQSPVPVLPIHMQKVTVTGTWCRWLPNADWPLWHAHHGSNMQGTVVGDLFGSPLKPFMGCADLEGDTYACDTYYDPYNDLTALAEEQSLKPFTCEVDVDPCWYNY